MSVSKMTYIATQIDDLHRTYRRNLYARDIDAEWLIAHQ